MTPRKLDNRQWVVKLLAGLVPGCVLTFGIMIFVGRLCGSTGNPMQASSQALMWLAAVLWIVCLNICFLFRSGLRAWAAFGGLACLVWLVVHLIVPGTGANP